MFRKIVAPIFLNALVAASSLAQTADQKKYMEILDFYRGLIIKQDYNCPQAHVLSPEKESALGNAMLVFCGAKGIKPGADDMKSGRIWAFRVIVSPKGRVTVSPIGN